MVELRATYSEGILRLQPHKYIEDGWYIEYSGAGWNLFEIPIYGGEPQHIGHYPSFNAAYNKAIKLI